MSQSLIWMRYSLVSGHLVDRHVSVDTLLPSGEVSTNLVLQVHSEVGICWAL